MLSSGVWAGASSKDYAYGRTDRDGKRFGEELERIGYKGDLPCAPQDWKCHFELHIEQGPILEAEGKEIGVVKGGQGIRWLDVTHHRPGEPCRLHAHAAPQGRAGGGGARDRRLDEIAPRARPPRRGHRRRHPRSPSRRAT